jgi:hypothetical protein
MGQDGKGIDPFRWSHQRGRIQTYPLVHRGYGSKRLRVKGRRMRKYYSIHDCGRF